MTLLLKLLMIFSLLLTVSCSSSSADKSNDKEFVEEDADFLVDSEDDFLEDEEEEIVAETDEEDAEEFEEEMKKSKLQREMKN